ncbi:MAG: BatB protein, partial [Mariprofundus sp.]|nr:BatB protein [Mariprofundus sp.]
MFSALSWIYPWLLLLLPLPWLLWRFLAPVQQTQAVAHIPFAADWDATDFNAAKLGISKLRVLMLCLLWLCLLLAAARPEWHDEAVELPVSGRDLVLAVDISGSMRVQDF